MEQYRITVNDRQHLVTLIGRRGSTLSFEVAGDLYQVDLERIAPNYQKQQAAEANQTISSTTKELLSPMPGIISKVLKNEPESVKKGECLVVIEAMKMENQILAPRDGKIKKLHIKQGQEISEGQALLSFE